MKFGQIFEGNFWISCTIVWVQVPRVMFIFYFSLKAKARVKAQLSFWYFTTKLQYIFISSYYSFSNFLVNIHFEWCICSNWYAYVYSKIYWPKANSKDILFKSLWCVYVNVERQQVIIFSSSNAWSKLHKTWYFVRVSKGKLIMLYLFIDIQTHLYFVYFHLWRNWFCFFFSKENLGKPRL